MKHYMIYLQRNPSLCVAVAVARDAEAAIAQAKEMGYSHALVYNQEEARRVIADAENYEATHRSEFQVHASR